jgi:hypothetical protein
MDLNGSGYVSEPEDEAEATLSRSEVEREEAVADALREVLMRVFRSTTESALSAALGRTAAASCCELLHETVGLAFIERREAPNCVPCAPSATTQPLSPPQGRGFGRARSGRELGRGG